MAKLTDRQKKKIIADYVSCQNYAEVSRKYQLSATTIKRVVQADPSSLEKVAQKKEQNTQDMLAYLDGKRERVQLFIDRCLEALLDPEKMQKARLVEITTAMGTVIDKFINLGQLNESALSKLDQLIEGINCEAKR